MAGNVLHGVAIVANSLSVDLGGFKEIIKPEAIRRALARKPDTRSLYNHNSDYVLGRTTAGTLELRESARGLETRIDLPDTMAGRDVLTSIQRRDITGMSFAFRVPEGGDRWSLDAQGAVIREVLDLELLEISIVAWPAYRDTSIAVAQRGAPVAGRSTAADWRRWHRQLLAS